MNFFSGRQLNCWQIILLLLELVYFLYKNRSVFILSFILGHDPSPKCGFYASCSTFLESQLNACSAQWSLSILDKLEFQYMPGCILCYLRSTLSRLPDLCLYSHVCSQATTCGLPKPALHVAFFFWYLGC